MQERGAAQHAPLLLLRVLEHTRGQRCHPDLLHGQAVGLSGLGALVAFCREVMPLDEERLDEARVVMAFSQEAAHDPARAAHNNRYMHRWRDSVAGWVAEARTAGDVAGHVDLASWVDALFAFLLGTQITAVLDPANVTPAHLERQLTAQLALVRVSAGSTGGGPVT